jgi:hypothetical protein
MACRIVAFPAKRKIKRSDQTAAWEQVQHYHNEDKQQRLIIIPKLKLTKKMLAYNEVKSIPSH